MNKKYARLLLSFLILIPAIYILYIAGLDNIYPSRFKIFISGGIPLIGLWTRQRWFRFYIFLIVAFWIVVLFYSLLFIQLAGGFSLGKIVLYIISIIYLLSMLYLTNRIKEDFLFKKD